MLNLNLVEFRQIAITLVASLMLTAVSVGAAVGPARAIETGPVYSKLA